MLPVLVFAANVAASDVGPLGHPTLPPDNDAPRKVRDGVALGVALGGGFAWGAGYPNDLNAIGSSNYASRSGLYGGSGTLLVMGALADTVNVGGWLAYGSFRRAGAVASQFGIGLRVEAFPLLPLYPALSGLGVFGEFGVGTAHLRPSGAPSVGGTQSIIGTGIFYEWAFGGGKRGHFAIGPSLEYDAIFTQPYDQNAIVASARLVWYGGP